MSFEIHPTKIKDVLLIQPTVFQDQRGSFSELFQESAFLSAGLDQKFTQVNMSVSRQNVLRGLHYQLPPKAQAKLVSVISGQIFDVAVDLRADSPTFRQWVGVKLDSSLPAMLYIPTGFAHGFYVISAEARVLYFCTDEYTPALERGIIWNDPSLGIDWPIKNPIISEKDQAYPLLTDAKKSFE